MNRNIIIIIIALMSQIGQSYAQTNFKLGGGYFGNLITYPGFVLEAEIEQMYSEKASMPLRIDVGFYSHPRYNDGIFADVNYGFRRYFKSGLFLEESIGIGVLQSRINSDGIFDVDDQGKVSEASRWNTTDLMPSITLGVGYDFSKDQGKQTLIWLRPKLFWQVPHKTSSLYTPSVQIGFTKTINSK